MICNSTKTDYDWLKIYHSTKTDYDWLKICHSTKTDYDWLKICHSTKTDYDWLNIWHSTKTINYDWRKLYHSTKTDYDWQKFITAPRQLCPFWWINWDRSFYTAPEAPRCICIATICFVVSIHSPGDLKGPWERRSTTGLKLPIEYNTKNLYYS